jgi:hypothetical protein
MRAFLLCLASAACSRPGPDTRAAGSGESDTHASSPCSPAALGLGSARRLPAWKPPATCTITAPSEPQIVTNATGVLDCTEAEPGIDFTRQRLLAQERMLSPATVEIVAFDDGTTITLVSRQVTPCLDDPRPMPVPTTLLYLVDAERSRVLAEATCTERRTCR